MYFAIHSVTTAVLFENQISAMAIFDKCPVCGEFAFVQPELGDKEHRVFRCGNDHQFKKPVKEVMKSDDREVWDHMPKWARMLNGLQKTVK